MERIKFQLLYGPLPDLSPTLTVSPGVILPLATPGPGNAFTEGF